MFASPFRPRRKNAHKLARAASSQVQLAIRALGFSWNQPLLPGRPGEGDNCPLANTFSAALPFRVVVSPDRLYVLDSRSAATIARVWQTASMSDPSNDSYSVELPELLQEFILRFDDGGITNLIEDDPGTVVILPPVLDYETLSWP